MQLVSISTYGCNEVNHACIYIIFTCTVSSCCNGPEVDTDSSVELLTYWNTFPVAVNDEVTRTLNPPFKIACP